MEKNNINDMDELRQQFAILTEKIKSQQINNERLLRTVMQDKMKWIDKYIYIKLFLLMPLLALMFLYFYQTGKVSLYFYITTMLLVAVEIGFDFFINKVLGKGWLKHDLLTSRQIFVKMKKNRINQMVVGIPICIVWASIFLFEFLNYDLSDRAYAIIMGTGIGIGCLVGSGIAFLIFRKMQRINDEIIQEIDNLKE